MINIPGGTVPEADVDLKQNIRPKEKKQQKGLKKQIPQTMDFLKWLESFSSGVSEEKLLSAISQLNNDVKNLATELILGRSNLEVKPTAKFKLEKVPPDLLKGIFLQIKNPYFRIQLLCNPISNNDFKIAIIKDLSDLNHSEENFSFLTNKIGSIKSIDDQKYIWESFLTLAFFSSGEWGKDQLKFLEWGFSHGLIFSNPVDTLMSLNLASEQFSEIESPRKNRIHRNLLERDLLTFWAFLIHISRGTLNEKFAEKILAKQTRLALLNYFSNRQKLVGPWTDEFEKRFIAPLLKNYLDSVMTFEELLPFLEYLKFVQNLLPSETLPRTVKRCFNRRDELSDLLSDNRVIALNQKLETLTDEIDNLRNAQNLDKSRISESETKAMQLAQAVESLESRLRGQLNSEAQGNEAVLQQAQMNLLKSLVEAIDHLLQEPAGFELERALQRIGILKAGEPKSEFEWDAEICETLTGSAIERGIVIRSGYTWMVGNKRIVIRRVLLKSK